MYGASGKFPETKQDIQVAFRIHGIPMNPAKKLTSL
jgi:hypothetical protein